MQKLFIVFLLLFGFMQSAYGENVIDTTVQDITSQQTDQKEKKIYSISVEGFDIPKEYNISWDYTGNYSECQRLSISKRMDESDVSDKQNTVPVIDLNKYLKSKITVNLLASGKKLKTYSGFIHDIAYTNSNNSYTINVCDEMYDLYLSAGSELFVNQSVTDIIKVILDKHKIHYLLELKGQYPKKEFIAQYNETDFDFIIRLMSEYGIFYVTKSLDNKDTHIFVDDIATLTKYTKEFNYKDLHFPEFQNCCADITSIYYYTRSDNYQISAYDVINDKIIKQSANSKIEGTIYKKFLTADYDAATIQKVAASLLDKSNFGTKFLTTMTNNPYIDLADRVIIGGQKYYVNAISLDYSNSSSYSLSGQLSLVPAGAHVFGYDYVSPPVVKSPMIGFVSDVIKDSKGRLGIRFPWMSEQSDDIMFRALLSANAQKLEYKKGDRIIVNFIDGNIEYPVIVDKL